MKNSHSLPPDPDTADVHFTDVISLFTLVTYVTMHGSSWRGRAQREGEKGCNATTPERVVVFVLFHQRKWKCGTSIQKFVVNEGLVSEFLNFGTRIGKFRGSGFYFFLSLSSSPHNFQQHFFVAVSLRKRRSEKERPSRHLPPPRPGGPSCVSQLSSSLSCNEGTRMCDPTQFPFGLFSGVGLDAFLPDQGVTIVMSP